MSLQQALLHMGGVSTSILFCCGKLVPPVFESPAGSPWQDFFLQFFSENCISEKLVYSRTKDLAQQKEMEVWGFF